jgi:dihydroxyacetone kinase-like protein
MQKRLMFRRIRQTLDARGIKVYHTWVGEFATSMEMAGASISLMRVDTELKEYLAAPADTPFYKQFQL